MALSHGFIFFLDAFSAGLISPVLSLVFLEHGATIETLALFVGIFSICVILAEFPSGIAADLKGRKNAFLLSHLLLAVNYLLQDFSKSPILLAAACILFGVGKAFGSGSLEALEVEQYIEKNGKSQLPAINSAMEILECAGLAAGALTGGILGSIGSRYRVILRTLIVIELLLVVLAIIFMEETRRPGKKIQFTSEIGQKISSVKRLPGQSDVIGRILGIACVIGCSQMILEVYWQQNFLQCLPENLEWMLGAVSCLGFAGSGIGSWLGSLMMKKVAKRSKLQAEYKWKKKKMYLYWLLRCFLPVTVMMLGLCRNWMLFVGTYLFIYIVLGSGNLWERTLLHENVENQYRASMLSVYSLFIRGGGVAASGLASVIMTFWGLNLVWILCPGVGLAAMLLIFTRSQKERRDYLHT